MSVSLTAVVPELATGYWGRAVIRRIERRYYLRSLPAPEPSDLLRWMQAAGLSPAEIMACFVADGRYVCWAEAHV